MSLTDTTIRNAKPFDKQYSLADGKGLCLLIKPNGSKYWHFRYRYQGKEKEISLKEARDKCDDTRKLIRNGLDPSQSKQEAKRKIQIETENSFEIIAREWHSNQKSSWTERHANYVLRRLEADIFPEIGERPIIEIIAPELLAVLRKIEDRGAIDIAHRALQTCGQILRYAIAIGKNDRDISHDLQGALKTRKKENYARLEAKELPEFLSKLELYDGDLKLSLL